MRSLLSLVLVTVVLACAGAALAYPSLIGPTGLVAVPNAQVVPVNFTDIAVDYMQRDQSASATNVSVYNGRVVVGTDRGIEFGGMYQHVENDLGWNVNFKVATPLLGGTWALGGIYARNRQKNPEAVTEEYDTIAYEAYLVGDYQLTRGHGAMPAITATMGANWLEIHNKPLTVVDVEWVRSGLHGLFGVEATFDNGISVVADYVTGNADFDLKPIYSAALRVPVSRDITAQVGYTNAANYAYWDSAGTVLESSEDHTLFYGLNYRFNTDEY